MTTPPKDALLAILRLWELSQGADFCDRCNGVIWPEMELVRCDFCVGDYGPPSVEHIQEAEKKHWKRIRAYEREMEEMYQEEGSGDE